MAYRELVILLEEDAELVVKALEDYCPVSKDESDAISQMLTVFYRINPQLRCSTDSARFKS